MVGFVFFLTRERRDTLTAVAGQFPCEAPARPEFPRQPSPLPPSGALPAAAAGGAAGPVEGVMLESCHYKQQAF